MDGLWTKAAIFLVAAGCISCSETTSPVPCVDRDLGNLVIDFTNDLSFGIEVPERYPTVSCCGYNGFFIYISNEVGVELPRCGLLSGIDGAQDIVIEPGGRFNYKLSEDSISSAYCDVDLTTSYLSVVYADNGSEHNFYGRPTRIGECFR